MRPLFLKVGVGIGLLFLDLGLGNVGATSLVIVLNGGRGHRWVWHKTGKGHVRVGAAAGNGMLETVEVADEGGCA